METKGDGDSEMRRVMERGNMDSPAAAAAAAEEEESDAECEGYIRGGPIQRYLGTRYDTFSFDRICKRVN